MVKTTIHHFEETESLHVNDKMSTIKKLKNSTINKSKFTINFHISKNNENIVTPIQHKLLFSFNKDEERDIKCRNVIKPLRLYNPPKYYLPQIYDSMMAVTDSSSEHYRYLKHFHFLRQCFGVMKQLPIDTYPTNISSSSHNNRLLVLDLDETLIHTFTKDPPTDCEVITITLFPNYEKKIYFKIRPNCLEFLDVVSKHFDVCIFTAGHKVYADPIIDRLDPNKSIFKARYFNDSCKKISQYIIKDLRILNRDLKDVLLVDNTALCFGLQKENGIPIVCYTGQNEDKELSYLTEFLLYLNTFEDVRNGIMKYFRWNLFEVLFKDIRALQQYYF